MVNVVFSNSSRSSLSDLEDFDEAIDESIDEDSDKTL